MNVVMPAQKPNLNHHIIQRFLCLPDHTAWDHDPKSSSQHQWVHQDLPRKNNGTLTDIACEQALHLGDIVKSTRARGTREETRLPLAARFARQNRRACSQAITDISFFLFPILYFRLLFIYSYTPVYLYFYSIRGHYYRTIRYTSSTSQWRIQGRSLSCCLVVLWSPVPGSEVVGPAQQNKTGRNWGEERCVFLSLPFSRHIFACLSLTRHAFYLRTCNRLT